MFNPRWEKLLLDIAGADDLERLRAVRIAEQTRLAAELAASAPASETVAALNTLHDALIARSLQLAEMEMARSGFGAPPVPYAYMLYGSGGRAEQTQSSDQDSGLVYADPASGEAAARCRDYFRTFAAAAVRQLITLGYPPCEGNVIASNPAWCMSLGEWRTKIDGWFAEPDWENVRYLLIVADGRPVAGQAVLGHNLKACFHDNLAANPAVVARMLENTLRHKVIVGVFGQLLRERYGENAGGLDIKYGAYIPMVNAIRLLALQRGIRETNTLARIAELRKAAALSSGEAERASEAFVVLLKLRMLTTVAHDNGQWVGSGKLSAAQLTKAIRSPLKKALKTGKELQAKVRRETKDRFGGR